MKFKILIIIPLFLISSITTVMLTICPVAVAHAAIINEIRIQQKGDDHDEYFELLGTSGESLDGLTYVVIGDGSNTAGGGSGVVEAVINLTGSSIPSDGYFLVGDVNVSSNDSLKNNSDLIASLQFENSDNVTHLLVTGFTGSQGYDLDTDDDGTLDSTPWASLVDAVGLVETKNSGDLLYGAALGFVDVGPNGSLVPYHVFRNPSTSNQWDIGNLEFGGKDTPGYANVPLPAAIWLFGSAVVGLLGIRRRIIKQ